MKRNKQQVPFKDMSLDDVFQLENHYTATIGEGAVGVKPYKKAGKVTLYAKGVRRQIGGGSPRPISSKRVKKRKRG
jgi:hypothetical protein